MVEFTRRVMSDERGTMSAGRGRAVETIETMLKLHGDGSRLTAHGQDEDEMQIAEGLPKAKTPHEQESLQRQIAATDSQIDKLVYELYGLTEEEIRIVGGDHMMKRQKTRGSSPLALTLDVSRTHTRDGAVS
jgi:hypothetical protein